MEYLRKFNNHEEFVEHESSLMKPNVSVCVTENDIHYVKNKKEPLETECFWLYERDSITCLGEKCYDGEHNCQSIFIPDSTSSGYVPGPLSSEAMCWVFQEPNTTNQLRIICDYLGTWQAQCYSNGVSTGDVVYLTFNDFDDESGQMGCYINIAQFMADNGISDVNSDRFEIVEPELLGTNLSPVYCKMCVVAPEE